MMSAQHNVVRMLSQLLASIGWKLRNVLAISGDILLSIGLRYGLLTLYVATVYVVVLALSGINANTVNVPWWLNLPALLIIVPTFSPMHHWLQHRVNELVYGQHDDPYTLLTQLNQHMEAATASDLLLPTLVTTLAATLKLPFVAIETTLAPLPLTTATYGVSPPHAEQVSLPLTYRATTLGTVRVSSRRPHERLSADDLRLLHDLARQVGITLHAAQLTEELQASREHLVLAREEERRRIRRDLHDGLGPTLASLRLQLGALRHTVRQNPEEAERQIEELRDDVRHATTEIRRLVYDLRPPMLDEFGLVGALRNLELATNVSRTVEAPEPMPSLPAAVEVALYRIAAEALHNIVRHSGADQCVIQLDVTKTTITLAVSDNGSGLPPIYLAGIGHRSMHERATELGGSVAVLPALNGGTSIRATFPLQAVRDE